jgi:hypothetical protein
MRFKAPMLPHRCPGRPSAALQLPPPRSPAIEKKATPKTCSDQATAKGLQASASLPLRMQNGGKPA